MLKVLFAGNGIGEDQSASAIAQNYRELVRSGDFVPGEEIEIKGASLLGGDRFFEEAEIPLIFKGKMPPSGGFPLMSAPGLVRDIMSGSLFSPLRYMKEIKRFKPHLLVIVGDPFFLLLNTRSIHEERNGVIIFLSLAKTERGQKHLPWEINWMKKYANFVLTRDPESSETLRSKGVRAFFLGNPMMDFIEPDKQRLKKIEELLRRNGFSNPEVLILPGSREEAYKNFPLILEAIAEASSRLKRKIEGIAALVPSWDNGKMLEILKKSRIKHWKFKDNVIFLNENIKILLAKGMFAEALQFCKVSVALAGTAMEQACGAGVPAVAFPGKGPQTTRWRIFKNQKGILGEALKTAKNPTGAGEILAELLSNPEELKRASLEGVERMGGKGGSKRIALAVLRLTETLLKEGFPERKVPSSLFRAIVDSVEPIFAEMERNALKKIWSTNTEGQSP